MAFTVQIAGVWIRVTMMEVWDLGCCIQGVRREKATRILVYLLNDGLFICFLILQFSFFRNGLPGGALLAVPKTDGSSAHTACQPDHTVSLRERKGEKGEHHGIRIVLTGILMAVSLFAFGFGK